MHIALIPILRTELGLDTLTIGLMASIPLLIQAVLTIPSGLLADRVDRLRMITASLVLSSVGGILMTHVNSIPLLIVFVSMFSIAPTLLHPPGLSTVSDLVSSKSRGKALGFFNSVGTLGVALGPITLSFLMGAIGWRLVYLMWSIPSLLLSVVILRLRIEKISEIENRRSKKKVFSELRILRSLSLILLLAIMGARAVSGTAINTYITPYFVDRWGIDPALASLILGIHSLTGLFAAFCGGVMADRVGEKTWIALSFASQVTSLAVVAFAPAIALTILGYLSYSFFGLMEGPAEQSLVVKLTPAGGRGLAFSLSFLPNTLVGSFSPILVAFVVEAWGIWYIFPFALAMLFTAMSILALLWRRPEQA